MKLLQKYLEGEGKRVYITREPTDSPMGALVHSCMTGRVATDDATIALLCAADRVDHLRNATDGILGKLEEGYWVITDRYLFSSYAYQGTQLPLKWVIEINRAAAETLKPDLNIYIDLDPARAFGRLSRRANRERYEELATLEKVRAKYFEAFNLLSDEQSVAVIESKEEPEETAKLIRSAVSKLL